jgi:hypothetical protein
LDNKGLGGLWHEALRAQNGLVGKVKGYANHPQLERFKAHPEPLRAIGYYLWKVFIDSKDRVNKNGNPMRFNFNLIMIPVWNVDKIPVTRGQVNYELNLLRNKLEARGAIKELMSLPTEIIKCPLHLLFFMVEGDVEKWEKVK